MIARIGVALLLVAGLASFSTARGEQRQREDGHIAHTRVAPVLMHRAFPPYTGIHVYEGRSGGSARRGR